MEEGERDRRETWQSSKAIDSARSRSRSRRSPDTLKHSHAMHHNDTQTPTRRHARILRLIFSIPSGFESAVALAILAALTHFCNDPRSSLL